MANAEAKGRRNAQEWGAVLERFATSGQSVETFCGAPSISAGSFYRWRSERQAIPPLASFVDLGRLGSWSSGSVRLWYCGCGAADVVPRRPGPGVFVGGARGDAQALHGCVRPEQASAQTGPARGASVRVHQPPGQLPQGAVWGSHGLLSVGEAAGAGAVRVALAPSAHPGARLEGLNRRPGGSATGDKPPPGQAT